MAFRIQVPDPCQEDWNAMLPRPNGRYCGTCDTVVPDLSRTSDEALIDLVQTNTLPHCARFAQGQLDRVRRPQPDPVARLQALVLAAAVVTTPAVAEAQVPTVEDSTQKKETAKKPKKLRFKVPAVDPVRVFPELLVFHDSSFATVGFSVIQAEEATLMPPAPPTAPLEVTDMIVSGSVAPMEEPTYYGFTRVEAAQRLPNGRIPDPSFCVNTPPPNAVFPAPRPEPEEPQDPPRPALLAVFFRHQRLGGSLRHWLASAFSRRTRV